MTMLNIRKKKHKISKAYLKFVNYINNNKYNDGNIHLYLHMPKNFEIK